MRIKTNKITAIIILLMIFNIQSYGQDTKEEERVTDQAEEQIEEQVEKQNEKQVEELVEQSADQLSDLILISEEAYEIMHPANWTADQTGKLGANLFLFSEVENEKDQFRENVNLILQDLNGYKMNLDQFVELSEQQIKTMITDSKIVSSERISNSELEFHTIEYIGSQGIYKLKFKQHYWVIGDTAYVLTLTCEVDKYDAFKEVGERILNSFKIKQK